MRRAALRSVTIAFGLATCGYALLCASAFTYHDFIRSDMFAVGAFARWHGWLAIGWAAAAIADIRATLPGRPRAQAIFAGVWAAVAIVLVLWPVLPRLAADRFSYVVALAALAPVICLAAADHAAVIRFLADPRHSRTSDDTELTEGRLAVAAVASVVFLTVAFAVLVPLLSISAFEPDLLTTGLTIGFGWSLVGHAVAFAIVFLAVALTLRATASASLVRQYAVVFLLALGVAMLGIDRVVCQVLGFEGVWRLLVACGLSAAIVGSWTAANLRGAAAEGRRLASGFELVAGTSSQANPTRAAAIPLLAIAVAGYAAARISAAVDWDFLFLTTALMLLWIAAFCALFRAAPPRRVGSAAILIGCLLPLAASFALRRAEPRWPDIGLSLNRYIVYNPSFRLSERLLRRSDAAGMPAFQRYLRANTALTGVNIKPVSMDLATPLGAAPVEPPPHVFLFVIDSLRPDYLEPYNAAVTFTPAIRQFSIESVVFPNAMTRYGATGLSLPAIWSGAVGTHRQYVLPFSPMNTLEKLLIANRYRRVMSLDVLMAPLLAPWSDTIALDHDRRTLDYDLCATLSELEVRFPPTGPHDPPVFGYSNPQNLHPSNLVGSPAGHDASYAGFYAPYAARVRAIDRCFGRFIEFLKRRQIYDRSLVVLTSDHGELLGEEGRWGHAYYLFPPILQVPLIVHLPAAAPQPIDRRAISFSIDIAPTIYAALGYRLQPSSPLLGEPLVGGKPADAERRRRADYVVEASYSSVYGVVRRNGRHVYVVDAVSGSDYAYDRGRAGRWTPVAVTDSLRAADQRIIREHIDRVRRIYHLPPET
jgi:hypothetical protein